MHEVYLDKKVEELNWKDTRKPTAEDADEQVLRQTRGASETMVDKRLSSVEWTGYQPRIIPKY